VNGTLLLILVCATGGLVGLLLGAHRGRPATGLFLGTFLLFLGWIMVLEGRPRALDASQAT
jgi:hypothetical protein